ncbi:hypothetical protein ECD80_07805 [Acinetobacter baumannii]|uniref:hypothetical protein n=1 Tax=Acinetobacter baumannii TaxID=470 RepID=UPI0022785234|nr:hypothetical protein [Acinetobacter baumannii]MCY3348950.1 hypothetical protein [Acinetobacter baumannii]
MQGLYIFQFFPVVLDEGIVLWRMQWASLPRSLYDLLMMHFASFLGLFLVLGPYLICSLPWRLTLSGTSSFLDSGPVPMLRSKRYPRLVWACALTANLMGCLFFAVEVLLNAIPGALSGSLNTK